MTDDHIKRFKLSERQPRNSFKPSAAHVRDKDNAQIPPPRPTFISFENARLAPMGSVGIRLQMDARRWMDQRRESNTKEYKPLGSRRPDKDRGWDR